MYNFLCLAMLAGIGITFVSAPLGSLMIWRRMAYFGDTLSHAALLGVALSFLMQTQYPLVGVGVISLLVGGVLLYWEDNTSLARDSLLGILSHLALALGIVVVSFIPGFRSDLFGFLFGDILAVNAVEVITIYACALIMLIILRWNWASLIAMTVNEELAFVEGVNVRRQKAMFVFMLAILIAMAIKVLGVLLITAMLIIPAAAARAFAKTPEGMVLIAWVFSVIAIVFGLWASLLMDVPAGPAIVVCAGITFVGSQLLGSTREAHTRMD